MDNGFLKEQIITYMGNKRKLLNIISDELDEIKKAMKKDNIKIGDGFSGSGVVSRLFKTKEKELYANDLAGYSKTLNACYLSSPTKSELQKIKEYISQPLPRSLQSLPRSQLLSIKVKQSKVKKLLSGLNPSKATGSDHIPALFLKKTAAVIYKAVTKIFRLSGVSLQLGVFPSNWKIADVVALHKKKSRSDPANYRPISLLPILSKLLETVVADRLKPFLRPLLHYRQFGFRTGRSTIDMLTQLSQNWTNALGKGQEVRAVALDISKAFDKVWHAGLLLKLARWGISGTLLAWFTSYLSDRRQRVCLNGSSSPFLSTNAGVPQGSVLGPILFLVFINDLFYKVENNLDVFADDSTLWAVIPKISSRTEVADSLNKDLAAIQNWATTWLVTYNQTKTELVTFSNKNDMKRFRKNALDKKKGSYFNHPTACPHPPLYFYPKWPSLSGPFKPTPLPERPGVKIVGLTFSFFFF